ncbi:hypothetical protein MHF_1147 [Mycoplasma haemofelis Ohio2]|uniref:Uncharacterized protein n=1 Tax=Mycoplasma haemofelis (strain Ohio2) TaxID=859194 RepID=F6FJN4_MYCHI|nr:hypothetical protein MHF_1147 [Mycoplasma haemofelis Ohio2]
MAYSKILALGGLTAASGSVVGGFFLSSSGNKETENLKTTSASIQEETPAPNGKCFVLVAGGVTRSGNTVNLTQILERVEGAEEFLKSKQISTGQFATDVRGACQGVEVSKEDKNVYVYQESNQSWNYTSLMQQQDWVNNPSVNKSESVLKS